MKKENAIAIKTEQFHLAEKSRMADVVLGAKAINQRMKMVLMDSIFDLQQEIKRARHEGESMDYADGLIVRLKEIIEKMEKAMKEKIDIDLFEEEA